MWDKWKIEGIINTTDLLMVKDIVKYPKDKTMILKIVSKFILQEIPTLQNYVMIPS